MGKWDLMPFSKHPTFYGNGGGPEGPVACAFLEQLLVSSALLLPELNLIRRKVLEEPPPPHPQTLLAVEAEPWLQ